MQQSLEPGYYRHRYGGVYHLTDVGLSTVDQSQHVIYRHIYPFEKKSWIRPLDEWTTDRFTPLTYREMVEITQIPEDELQQQITAAKAASK